MTNQEYQYRLYELRYTSAMNARYHQILNWRWGVVDKVIRISLAVLTVGGLVLSVPSVDAPWPGFWVALLSVVMAFTLTVLPVGNWEKHHGELFRLWSDLRKDVVIEENKSLGLTGDEGAGKNRLGLLNDFIAKANNLDGQEPAPWRSLIGRCQEDENESIWGKGIRKNEQIEKERERRLGFQPTNPSGPPRTSGEAGAVGLE